MNYKRSGELLKRRRRIAQIKALDATVAGEGHLFGIAVLWLTCCLTHIAAYVVAVPSLHGQH